MVVHVRYLPVCRNLGNKLGTKSAIKNYTHTYMYSKIAKVFENYKFCMLLKIK